MQEASAIFLYPTFSDSDKLASAHDVFRHRGPFYFGGSTSAVYPGTYKVGTALCQ